MHSKRVDDFTELSYCDNIIAVLILFLFQITLASYIEQIRDKLAENIHEMWAMNKVNTTIIIRYHIYKFTVQVCNHENFRQWYALLLYSGVLQNLLFKSTCNVTPPKSAFEKKTVFFFNIKVY